MGLSDFSRVHHRLQSLNFPIRPENTLCSRVKSGISRFAYKGMSLHARATGRAGPVKLAVALHRILPPVVSGRRHTEVRDISRLNNLACSSSCLRLRARPCDHPARLGAGHSTVRPLHSLHPASLLVQSALCSSKAIGAAIGFPALLRSGFRHDTSPQLGHCGATCGCCRLTT